MTAITAVLLVGASIWAYLRAARSSRAIDACDFETLRARTACKVRGRHPFVSA
jgi:hypothetical protein